MSIRPDFYSYTPLTEDELYQRAPSIFNRLAHPSRSEKFKPIATIDVVRQLANEGFVPYGASQNRTLSTSRAPFTKHMLKFRKLDTFNPLLRVGDSALEVILTNGNDGSKAFHLDAGIFKLACLNGMVVKSTDYGGVVVRHTGEAIEKVVIGTHQIAMNADKAMKAPQDWVKIMLDDAQRLSFATQAHKARFGTDDRVKPAQLLIPRREKDFGHDLWSVFNVIQENTVRGGLSATRRGASRQWTTRGIRGIDQNMRLNKTLWELAEKVAKEAA